MEQKITREFLIQNKVQFKYYPKARYATDVIFQMPNRPCENIRENKFDFSGMHHLYDLKTKFSVAPNRSINCGKDSLGSVADSTIFQKRLSWESFATKKFESKDDSLEDDGGLNSEYSKNWAILVDKERAGLQENIRAIIPKPLNAFLSIFDKNQNEKLAYNRVIVEFFLVVFALSAYFSINRKGMRTNTKSFFKHVYCLQMRKFCLVV